MNDTTTLDLHKVRPCRACGRKVAGTDEVGRCVGCRIHALLTPTTQGVLAVMRRVALDRPGRGIALADVQARCGHASSSTTYHHLKALREHRFIDWDEGSKATIHLTRGI